MATAEPVLRLISVPCNDHALMCGMTAARGHILRLLSQRITLRAPKQINIGPKLDQNWTEADSSAKCNCARLREATVWKRMLVGTTYMVQSALRNHLWPAVHDEP